MATIMHNVWYHAHYVLTEEFRHTQLFLKSNIKSLTDVYLTFSQRHFFIFTFLSASVSYFNPQSCYKITVCKKKRVF